MLTNLPNDLKKMGYHSIGRETLLKRKQTIYVKTDAYKDMTEEKIWDDVLGKAREMEGKELGFQKEATKAKG